MDEKRKTNVIWIFGDQQPAYSLAVNGDPNACTPNLDTIAVNGMNFRGAVCGFPLGCPFRGALLTGRYPHKTVPGHEYRLDPDERTIAQVLGEAGYETAYFGKWHLDGHHEREGRAAFHTVPSGKPLVRRAAVLARTPNSRRNRRNRTPSSPHSHSMRRPISAGCGPIAYRTLCRPAATSMATSSARAVAIGSRRSSPGTIPGNACSLTKSTAARAHS